MPTTRKSPRTPPSTAKEADKIVRIRDLERDLGSVLRHAAQKPVRISSKDGARMFHIATIRCGDRSDPTWANAMPVGIAALKRRAGRILHLASGLQITLRVRVTASPGTYFIEPGSECLEFASQRLGGPNRDVALLRNAMRRSQIARAAAEAAVKRVDTRRRDEVKSLQSRIATLERAVRKRADLGQALRKTEAALLEARQSQRVTNAAAKKNASERDEEVQTLKTRIATLERALKRQTQPHDPNRHATMPIRQPESESSPFGVTADASSATKSIATA